jgi:hypothetical protein
VSFFDLIKKICNSREHIKNYMDVNYASSIESGLELAEKLLTGWAQNITSQADIVQNRSIKIFALRMTQCGPLMTRCSILEAQPMRLCAGPWPVGAPLTRGKGGRARGGPVEVAPSEAGREAGSGSIEGAGTYFKSVKSV